MVKNKKCNWLESSDYNSSSYQKMKSKQRLSSGFFHKLRLQRLIKKQQRQRKLSSIHHHHHHQTTTTTTTSCCTSRPRNKIGRLIKKQHQHQHQGKLSSSIDHPRPQSRSNSLVATTTTCKLSSSIHHQSRSNSLVATKQGKMVLISNTTTTTPMMPLVMTNNNFPMILKKHKERSRSFYDHVPEELLAEILVRLPVKYILRCTSVRKSWYSLIKTPMFITLHLNYQKKKQIITPPSLNNPKFLFFKTVYTESLTLRFDHVQCQDYCTPKCPPALPQLAWHAPSYGLVATSTLPFPHHNNAKPEIYLWNPLLQKYKTLPHSPLPFRRDMWKALAFGFVPEFNDYLVVHVVKPQVYPLSYDPNPHSLLIGVYSLKTNSWKKIRKDNVFIHHVCFDDAVFVNGAAFWLGVKLDGRKIIMCFDTNTDILREISLPHWVKGDPNTPVIHLFGQSIAYFVWDIGVNFFEANSFDMWILKYNSINEFSWEKKMSVHTSEGTRVEVLGVRNSGEPIVAKSYNLISYNLDNHEANDFVDSWDRWTPFLYYEEGFAPPFFISPFVESLVLLDIN